MNDLPLAEREAPALAGIVLAAGQSKRMGRPKMALPWGDTTVVGKVITTLGRSSLSEICVVTGGDRAQVEQAVREVKLVTPLELVFNPFYRQDGMISSIQVGLAALGKRVEAAIIALGDQPQIELTTIEAVLEAFKQQQASMIVPSYKMHRGHPWLVRRTLWGEIQGVKPPQNMRDFLNANAAQIHYVLVDSDSVLQDIDTPEDYRRYTNPG